MESAILITDIVLDSGVLRAGDRVTRNGSLEWYSFEYGFVFLDDNEIEIEESDDNDNDND